MPKSPTGSAIANLLTIQRLGNGLSLDAQRMVADLFDDIIAQLARIDPTAPNAARWRKERVDELVGIVDELSKDGFDQVHKDIHTSLAEIGVQQGEWAVDQLDRLLGGVAVDITKGKIGVNLMKSILDTEPVQGAMMKAWWDRQAKEVAWGFQKRIRLGMAQNETIGDLVRRIRGRATGKRGVYSGGLMQVSTRNAEALVRTAVNEIVNRAHFATYEANADITTSYKYLATLDGRTTPICMALDGKVWRYDDPDGKRPPQHWGCRSTITPEIDWDGLGMEPPPEGKRASQDGPVAASTDYEGWLKGKTLVDKQAILGKTKGQMFHDGEITLRDLVRKDNSIVTVEQLRDRG